MGTLKHFQASKRPAAFWSLMGPMFASAAVHRDLQTLHDEPDNDEWFVTLDSKGEIVWFGCLRSSGESAAELCHYWVRPADREKNHGKKITDTLMERAKERGLQAVHVIAGPALVADLKKRGFTEGKARGKYVRMEATL